MKPERGRRHGLPRWRGWALGALLVVALALVALAQRGWLARPSLVWNGAALALVTIVPLALITARAGPALRRRKAGREPGLRHEIVAGARQAPWRVVVFGLSLVSLVLALRGLAEAPDSARLPTIVVFWGIAITLYLVAVAPPHRRPREDLGLWWEVNQKIVLLLGAILLVTAVARLVNLDSVPAQLGPGEARTQLAVLAVLDGEVSNPFGTLATSGPAMAAFLRAPLMGITASLLLPLRLPSAVLGTITVVIVFWLVTRLKGLTLGMTTAALLGVYHFHIHFSRMGTNDIAGPFFVALALLLLYRAYDRRSPLDWALCGVVVGLAQYAYASAPFVALLVAFLIGSFIARDGLHFWREQRRGILIVMGAALITAAPMIQHAILHPEVYSLYPAWARTPGASPPLLDLVSGALFLVGLGYATIRLDDRRLFPLAAWWWGAVLGAALMTSRAPSGPLLLTASVPTIFFVALALQHIERMVRRGWSRARRIHLLAYLTLAVVALSLTVLPWYLEEYTHPSRGAGADTWTATKVGFYARERLGATWPGY